MAIRETEDNAEVSLETIQMGAEHRKRAYSPDRLIQNPGMDQQIQEMVSPANALTLTLGSCDSKGFATFQKQVNRYGTNDE